MAQDTKATKKAAPRKRRTIEEQIAELKEKQRAQAQKKRERLLARLSEEQNRIDRYRGLLEKAETARAEIEKEIDALEGSEEDEADAS